MAEAKKDKILGRCGERISIVYFHGAPHVFAGATSLSAGTGGAQAIQTHPCGAVIDFLAKNSKRSRVLIPWSEVQYAVIAEDEP